MEKKQPRHNSAGSFLNGVLICLLIVSVSVVLNSTTVFAQVSDPVKYRISIPSINAVQAFDRLSEQTGAEFLFPYNLAEQRTTQAIDGRYTVMEALALMLRNTGLASGLSDNGAIRIYLSDSVEGHYEGMSGMNSKKKLLASTVAFFVGGGVSNVGAQGVGPDDQDANYMLEEVVITATKRETSVQDSALSVAVIGSEDINSRGLSSMDDYLRITPGANFIERGVGTNAVIIRGISSDPQRGASLGGPAVGVYFGEAPIAGLSILGGSADIQLVDMDRVEVLRGPQGTLFGSGSLSGTVRNVPTAPEMGLLEGNIKAEYSDTAENGEGNHKVSGMINIPLIEETLALRALAYENKLGGYVDNNAASFPGYSDVAESVGAGHLARDKGSVGETTYTGGRMALLWRPVDELDITLQYVTQEIDQDGTPDVQINTGGYTQTRLQFADLPSTNVPEFGFVPGNEHSGEGRTNDVNFANLVIDYDLGWGSLVSSTLSYEEETLQELGLAPFFGGLPAPLLFDFNSEAFVQELRLVSELDGPFQYIAGLYYEDISIDRKNIIHWGADLSENTFGTPFGPDSTLLDLNYVDRDIEQKAFFSEVSYDVSEELEVTLGGRWYSYDREANSQSAGVLSGDDKKSAKFDESDSNYKANISYRPTEDSLYYFQWSEGFRLGSTQNPIPKEICDIDDDNILDGTTLEIQDGIESDTLENFEVGAKLTVLDNRMNINTSIYRINWDGIPVSAISPSCLFTAVANAGEAKSEGLEIQVDYSLLPGLVVNLGGAYNNAGLTEDAEGLGASGDRLPGTPEYSANVGFLYEFDISSYSSYLRADYSYVGSYYNNLQETGEKAGGYSQLNMSAGIQFNSINLGVFANNLTNADDFTWVDSSVPDTRAYRLRPRTIGLRTEYAF